MAYASGVRITSLAGLIGAGVGAYLGYNYAETAGTGVSPVQGALILGAVGLILGSAGAFILKSLMQFLVYLLLIMILAYVFRGQIEAITGIDPVNAVLGALGALGVPVPEAVENVVNGGE